MALTLELKNPTGVTVSELNITLEQGKIYTAWAKGLVSASGTNTLGIQVFTH